MNPHNTMALVAGIVIVVLVVALIIAYYVSELIDHWEAKRNPPGPDVGVDIVDCGMVADVDEDIHHPSLETIDLALRHMDRDNAGAVDWLLEKRLEAMRRAS